MPVTGALCELLRQRVLSASAKARAKRRQRFQLLMRPTAEDRILDLGSEDGTHVASLVSFRSNVTIADIDPRMLASGAARFGFSTLLIEEDKPLAVPDHAFDIIFCSSVIEHVTVNKAWLNQVQSRREFEALAFERQRAFASEIARIGRRYFVQTPYRYFPIDSHTWLPAPVAFLPRPVLIRLVTLINRWWIKTTVIDFNLLNRRQMRQLFPDAEIISERWFGLTKSLIAVRV